MGTEDLVSIHATLIRLEDGIPPNWHWPTDTQDNIDYRAMRDTLAYARILAQAALGP